MNSGNGTIGGLARPENGLFAKFSQFRAFPIEFDGIRRRGLIGGGRALAAVALILLAIVLAGCAGCGPTPPPVVTPSVTVAATATPTERPPSTPTLAPSATHTPEPSATPRATATATVAPSSTPRPTATPTPTRVPLPEGEVIRGWASAYAPGVMERVAWYHWGNLPPSHAFTGMAAVYDCRRIGDIIWLRPGAGDWEPILVADCAKRGGPAQAWMLTNNILVELDWQTWQRWQPYRTGRGLPVEWLLE